MCVWWQCFFTSFALFFYWLRVLVSTKHHEKETKAVVYARTLAHPYTNAHTHTRSHTHQGNAGSGRYTLHPPSPATITVPFVCFVRVFFSFVFFCWFFSKTLQAASRREIAKCAPNDDEKRCFCGRCTFLPVCVWRRGPGEDAKRCFCVCCMFLLVCVYDGNKIESNPHIFQENNKII
jgi:hypothetical protein